MHEPMHIVFLKSCWEFSGDSIRDIKAFSDGTQQQSAPQTKFPSILQQQQAQQAQQAQQPQKQQQKAKKKRPVTPEHQLLLDVQSAAKAQNPAAAVAVYHAAVAAGTPLNPSLYSTLLYLCAGGESWELPLRQQLTETTPLVQDIMQQAAADVAQQEKLKAEADMQATDTGPTTATATAVAEPAASTSDSELPSPQAATANGHATAAASSANHNMSQPAKTVSSPSFPLNSHPQTPSHGLSAAAGTAAVSHKAESSASPAEMSQDEPLATASLPPLTPRQLSREGRAIFDQMQVCAQVFQSLNLHTYI